DTQRGPPADRRRDRDACRILFELRQFRTIGLVEHNIRGFKPWNSIPSSSRIQFAFVISFHIIFPSFTIGLGAWLATIEGARLFTGNELYRRVFDFWLKIFALSFG